MIFGHPAATARAYAQDRETVQRASACATAIVENALPPGRLTAAEIGRLAAQIERDFLVFLLNDREERARR